MSDCGYGSDTELMSLTAFILRFVDDEGDDEGDYEVCHVGVTWQIFLCKSYVFSHDHNSDFSLHKAQAQ